MDRYGYSPFANLLFTDIWDSMYILKRGLEPVLGVLENYSRAIQFTKSLIFAADSSSTER